MRTLHSTEIIAVNGGNLTGLVADAFFGCILGTAASLFIDAPRINVIISTTVLFAAFYGLTEDYY